MIETVSDKTIINATEQTRIREQADLARRQFDLSLTSNNIKFTSDTSVTTQLPEKAKLAETPADNQAKQKEAQAVDSLRGNVNFLNFTQDKPETAKPDVAKPDAVVQADAGKPETTKPETTTQGSVSGNDSSTSTDTTRTTTDKTKSNASQTNNLANNPTTEGNNPESSTTQTIKPEPTSREAVEANGYRNKKAADDEQEVETEEEETDTVDEEEAIDDGDAEVGDDEEVVDGGDAEVGGDEEVVDEGDAGVSDDEEVVGDGGANPVTKPVGDEPAPNPNPNPNPNPTPAQRDRGKVSDVNGNNIIDLEDASSSQKMSMPEIGKELADSDAGIVLIGEFHDTPPQVAAEETIKAAKADGKYVVYGMEMGDDQGVREATDEYLAGDIDEATYRERGAKALGVQLKNRDEVYNNVVNGIVNPNLTPEQQAQYDAAVQETGTRIIDRVIGARNAGADEIIFYDDNNSLNRDQAMEEKLLNLQGELTEEFGDDYKIVIATGAHHARKEGFDDAPKVFPGIWSDLRDPLGERLEKALGDDAVQTVAAIPLEAMKDEASNPMPLRYSDYDAVYG